MEIFIKIPFKKQAQDGSILHIAKEDLLRGLDFIRKDQPVIGKVLIITCGLNLFLAAMIVTGMPYIITEVLMPGSLQANKLCGYAEGALAAGGLAGGIFAGVFAGKLSVKKAGMLRIKHISCKHCAGDAISGHYKLYNYGSMLFYNNGIINNFYYTDAVFCTVSNATGFNRESNGCYTCRFNVFTAFRQCIIWNFL